MNNQKKFSIKNLFFMIKCIFFASPLLFPLLILVTAAVNILGIWGVFILGDISNSLVQFLSDSITLNTVILLVFLYIAIQLLFKNLFKFLQEVIKNLYYKQADRYFRILLLYKLGKTEQEKMYDNDFYNKYEYTYTYLYMFQQLPWHLTSLIIDFAFTKIMYLIIVFTFNVWIGLYCLCFFLFNILLTQIIAKKRAKADYSLIVPDRRKKNYLELLTEKNTVKERKIFRYENVFLSRYKKYYFETRNKRFKNSKNVMYLRDAASFIVFFSKNALNIFLLYLVFINKIGVGDWVIIQTIASILFSAGYEITYPTQYLVQFVSYSPIMIEMLYPLTKSERKEMVKFEYGEFSLCKGFFQKLQIKNVCYTYPNSKEEVVKNINFEIKKGEIVSILGYNGSGKTTLCKIISGVLTPSNGEVLINNVSINEIKRNDYYKYFGIAFQDYAKYFLSIRENIGFGKIESIDNLDLVCIAIDKFGLEKVIAKMPFGLDTILGKTYDENGQDLSGGEWQKIILARAIMGNPEVLLFDEPTASIDPFEEEKMLDKFHEIINGKTAILISHRISFARLAHKIIIMKDGEIIETGTHEELLDKKGYYYHLFNSQQNLYKNEVSICEE